jgi:ribonuclease Z
LQAIGHKLNTLNQNETMSTEHNEANANATQKSSVNRRDALKGLAAAAATAAGAVAAAQAANPAATPAEGLPQNPYGGKANTGITLPPYYRPTPSVKNANTFFPQAEELGKDEMRISFIGSTPVPPTRSQAGTCIMVELGKDKRFFFDFGNGALKNLVAMQVPIQVINDIFFTHLHTDHYADLPYLYAFAPWMMRWKPLRVHGPSGRTEKDGIKYMIEGMKMMTHWHTMSFACMPVGDGYEVEVNEFDFKDDGGICYNKDGVVIRHWRRAHGGDGASGYRLDWKGLSFVWTGDGRPEANTVKYSKGADVFVTEIVPDTSNLMALKFGMPPIIGSSTIDMCHTPHYATGYMFKQVEPRIAMVTHLQYDESMVPEMVAGIRAHWDGLFAFGAPDVVVVNVTKDAIWTRRAALPEDANFARPSKADAIALFDISPAHLTVEFPNPRLGVTDIEASFPRSEEYDAKLWYPTDVYRKPQPSFPRDFKIDLKKVMAEKIEAKIEAAKEGAEETVEDWKKKIEELQQKIKNKLEGK